MTEKPGERGTRRLSLLLIVLVLGALYFSVRIHNTETLATNDEPFWVGRSANFYRAVVDWEPEHTYQMAHPGVPVMWAGAIAYWLHAPEYAHHFDTNADHPFAIDDRLVATGIDPMEMLQQARIAKLSFETALFAVSILLITSVSTRLVAAITGVLIALDPFLAGFGPLLHVDSLLTISLFTASLAIVWASLHRNLRYPWLIAGAIAAIAVLTRTTGAAIGIPLVIAAIALWREFGRDITIRSIGAWVAGFGAVYIGGWPALWVRPVETVRAMIDWTIGAASDGHENALFFNSEILWGDPGLHFYPVTMLWRTTPLTWLGIGLVLLSLRSKGTRSQIRRFAPVLAMGLTYLVVMSLGAKKFDRYVLPAYPVIALMTAFGFDYAIRRIQVRLSTYKRVVPAAALAIIALVSLIPLSNAGPYRLNYYNEVMSIFQRPENSIQIGWGEGAWEAIEFLERESERLGRPVTVQTFVTPSDRVQPPIRYFTIGPNGSPDSVVFTQAGLISASDWYGTDYFLFHIQQTQRNMVSQYPLFAGMVPVHTIEFGGVVIWEIYAPNQLPLPDSIPDD